MIYTVIGFGVVNKAEVNVFLELLCFFDGPAYVRNLVPLSFLNPDEHVKVHNSCAVESLLGEFLALFC